MRWWHVPQRTASAKRKNYLKLAIAHPRGRGYVGRVGLASCGHAASYMLRGGPLAETHLDRGGAVPPVGSGSRVPRPTLGRTPRGAIGHGPSLPLRASCGWTL